MIYRLSLTAFHYSHFYVIIIVFQIIQNAEMVKITAIAREKNCQVT
jgi:hypothetical protein